MTADVLPELAKGGAELLLRVLERESERPSSNIMKMLIVGIILRQSDLSLDIVRTYRDRLSGEIHERGVEPGVLRDACETSLQTLEVLDDGYQRLLTIPIQPADRKEVERQETLAAEIRQTFAEWSEALELSFPPIDLKKLEEEARADADAGRMIRVERFCDLFPSHTDEK